MKFKLTPQHIIMLKGLIHALCLGYLATYYYWAFTDQLGADPVKAIIHFTGMGAFNVLLLTLLVSPIAKRTKQSQLMKVRRLLGLYALTYAFAHLLNFLFFDLQFDWSLLIGEIIERPYITVGFLALCILFSMAVTSPKFIQKKMRQAWQKLHNWVYLALPLVALHFIWSVKAITLEPLIYIAFTAVLLYQRKDKLNHWIKIQNKT